MKKIFIFLLCLPVFLVSSQIKGKVTDLEGKPVPGVNIYWLNSSTGTVSDNRGAFSIDTVRNNKTLIFSSVSFKQDTLIVENSDNPLWVKLNDVIELKELSVLQKSPGTFKARFSAIPTEKITAAELCKAACCNLSESFETNPSVDVAYSDAATGAKQIKLLGLSGTYVQMLTENIPNLRGISSLYGLGYIPGPWMESIQVSKGIGSVINGYEAITGQINVEYKKPVTDEIAALNMFVSDAGRAEVNLTANARFSPYLSTGVLLHASDEFKDIDNNGDGFSDMPMVKQYNLINRWYYKRNGFVSQLFLHALSENRMSGLLDKSYVIDIETERYEFFMKNGYVFDAETETSAGWIISGSMHNQDGMYGHNIYSGEQKNLYSNLIFQTQFNEKSKISTGFSFNYDFYNEMIHETIALPGNEHQKTNLLSNEISTGIFGEYSYKPDEKFNMLLGSRLDYHNKFGFFVTPRIHLRYSPVKEIMFRASAGKGYRSPKVLAENAFFLASNREIVLDDNLKMESAANYGFAVQTFPKIFEKELNLTAEWFLTDFQNQVVVDMDEGVHKVHFYNLQGKSYASSIQLEANMEVVRGLTLTVAHRWNKVETTYDGILREKPLTNRTKGLITASYQTPLKKWQFDFTTQFNGGGRMPLADVSNPLWKDEFSPFTIINSQITKYFKKWSVYAGVENLTGFVQENPVIDVANPFGDNFDATMIWGPTHGRKLYLGFRWSIDGETKI